MPAFFTETRHSIRTSHKSGDVISLFLVYGLIFYSYFVNFGIHKVFVWAFDNIARGNNMQARRFGVAILVLIGLIIASFVVAEMKSGLSVGSADASLLGGNTLYVGGSGPNNYTKIQDAINDANDGDTVFVYNGTYYENIVVNKAINLIGENKVNTIIDGSKSGDVVYVSVDNVNIRNLTIQNSGSEWKDAGIKLKDIQNCHIKDNNISNNDGNGIFLLDSSKCIITNNTLNSNNENGICLMNNSVSNSIIGNTINYTRVCGIHLFYSSNNSITGNIISNTQLLNGICLLSSSNNNHIRNNNISNNDGNQAIYSDSSINCDITNNTIINNSGDGIYLNGNGTIKNNTIINNSGDGISFVFLSKYPTSIYLNGNGTITNNTIINNRGDGISFVFLSKYPTNYTTSSNWIVANNTISNNSNSGIYLDFYANYIITGNTISNNSWSGIQISYSRNSSIHHNNIYGNADHGIDNYDSVSEHIANATYNWWGSADGPGGVGLGNGDNISTNVIYEPWLTNPYGIENYPSNKKTTGFEFIVLLAAMAAVVLARKRKLALKP